MADEDTIDWLAIEVSGDATRATKGIDALTASLGRLDKSLGSPAKKLGQLSRALRQLKTDASSVNLNGVKVSAATARNMKSLADATKGIDAAGAASLRSLASGVHALSGVNAKGIGSAVTQLKKLPAVFETYSKMNVSSFISQIQKLNAAIGPLAANVSRLSSAINTLPRSMRTAGAAARSVAASNKYLDMSYKNASNGVSGFTLKTKGLLAASQGAFAGLAYLINQSTKFVEDMNLFEASMGDATQAATEFGQKCQDLMGIDFGELARNQGVFETLITGMGETKEHADVMSQQLTQLGYDIASFFNISTEDAMLKIQSGIAGELEPLRRIGWDLSDARMQIEANNLGIDKSTQAMTQAEKVALRYYMIMNQVTIVHGDMARTIASPANQLRVLKMQLQLAARTVGNLFIPALNAILPVAIAVVKAITMVAQAIASLFGIDATFQVDYSGLDTSGIASGADDASDLADSLGDVGDSAGDATDKVKELKNTVMGFDELNKLNDNSDSGSSGSSGSGGSGGSGGGGDLGIPLDTYDFFDGLSDKMNAAAEEMARKMVNVLKKVAPVVAGIGAGFLAWKLAPKLLDDVAKLKAVLHGIKEANTFTEMGKAIGIAHPAALGIAAVVAVIVAHFTNLAINSENFRRGCVAAWEALDKLGGGIWSFLTTFGANVADAVRTAFGMLGIDVTPILNGLGEVGSMVNQVFDLQWSDALMVAAAMIAGVLCPPLGVAVAALEGVSLGIRALGWATSPVIEQVDALGGVSEETASRFGTSLDSMTGAFDELAKCSLPNSVVSEEDVSTVQARIADVHDTLVNNLDAKRNEELANIDLLADMLPEDTVQAMKDRTNEVYDNQVMAADEAQNRLYQIYATAAEEHRGLTSDEAAQVKEIQDGLQESLIQSSGASAEEIQTIRSNMANNNKQVALEEASSVLQAAIEKRDGEVQAAWDAYDAKMQAADAAYEAGDITQEQYDAIKQSALDAAQTQENAANETYYGENGVVNNVKSGLGDAANELDYQSGDMKSKWQVFCDGVSTKAREMGDGVKGTLSNFGGNAKRNWNDMTSHLRNAWYQAGDEITAKANSFTSSARATLSSFGSNAAGNWESFTWRMRSAWWQLKDNVTGAFVGIGDWFYWNVYAPINDWFWGIARAVKDAINNIIWHLNCLRIDLPEAVQQVTGWSSIGFNISYLARGGFVDDGQLFVAREAGPEMVGTMGGKTAVANNDQIVAGIERGVINAMVQVLGGSGSSAQGDTHVSLVVGREELARAVVKGMRTLDARGEINVDFA